MWPASLQLTNEVWARVPSKDEPSQVAGEQIRWKFLNEQVDLRLIEFFPDPQYQPRLKIENQQKSIGKGAVR
jgi:hypothetical protein